MLTKIAAKNNIRKFSAIITVFNEVIDLAQCAIDSGDYKKVWKAVHEDALIAAAKNIKNLPELRELAVEMLCDLSAGMIATISEAYALEVGLNDLDAPEANARRVKNLSSTTDEIEEIIRAAEAARSDKKETVD